MKVVVLFVVATVTPPRRWGQRTEERGEEPRTVRWRFRRSWVAGTGANFTFFTGGEKLTFFIRGWLGTEGPGTEAGCRPGRPRTGGTPGTTGTEEITGFNLSTDTESDLSPILRKKKILRTSENSIGPSVQRRQLSFWGIISDKNKLCRALGKGWGCSWGIMWWQGGPEKPRTACSCSTLQRKPTRGSSECSRNSPGRGRFEP